MDRLRRSLRDSFRRRSSSGSPSERHVGGGGNGSLTGDTSKPHIWSQDEATVRSGTCSFGVKYLGAVEVSESRGMQICEEALKLLRTARRRPVKGVLYVSGDGLRVVDSENKGLVVDQTIEKVSFCAPDRNHERGFAYICRDGTTRRWMCHGFHAGRDSGERLSHAVGCAFAVCLERKQKRDRETQQISSNQPGSHQRTGSNNSTASTTSQAGGIARPFERQGSYRQMPLNERLQDPQNVKPVEKPPVRPAINPHAVARPHGNRHAFERQGSLRMPAVPLKDTSNGGGVVPPIAASNQDMFRRFNSLRLNELPSNLARYDQLKNAMGPRAILEEECSPRDAGKSSSFTGPSTFFGAQSNSSYFSPPVSELSSPMSQTRSISFDAPIANGQGNSAASMDLGFGGGSMNSAQANANSRVRADEWLHTATKQAKVLQQYRMSPPVSEETLQANSMSNARTNVSFPPASAVPQLDSQRFGVGSNTRPPFHSMRANTVDFGLVSGPQPVASTRSVFGGPLQQSTAITDFDARWNALSEQRRHSAVLDGASSAKPNFSSTNPFSQESSSVKI